METDGQGGGCLHHHPVFVVEDDPDIREAVAMILMDEGYEVVTACNGAEAEDKMAHMDDPCVILLDLMMPVMNGWELLDHLKRSGRLRGKRRLHVIVVSASPTQVPSGPVATMRKPVRAEQLLKTVQQYC